MNPTLTLDLPAPWAASPAGRRGSLSAPPPAPDDTPVAPGPTALRWGTRRRRPGLLIGVAALHMGGLWGIAHSMVQPAAPRAVQPVQVRLIQPPEPRQTLPPAPLQAVVTLPQPASLPLVQPPRFETAEPVAALAAAQPAAPAQPHAATVPVSVGAAAPTAPAAAPAVREIAAAQVRYRVKPQPLIPRMSKRLGESGTVVLRILVDATGTLRGAVVKQSSGFARLDQQALLDIHTARFDPYEENGQRVSWEADAGLAYELH